MCSAPVAAPSVLGIPVGMRRPLPASKAGRPRPLIQAGGTDTTRLESVPRMAAVAEPAVVGRGRPVTLRATDMRSGRTFGRGIFDLSLGRSRDGGHYHHYETEKATGRVAGIHPRAAQTRAGETHALIR